MAAACRVMRGVLSIMVAACGPSDMPDTNDRSAATNAFATQTHFLVKVDYFYATSSDAERHFAFFRDTLGLAVAWPYRDYGGFASGGLSAGNSVIEFVKWTPVQGEIVPLEWKAIAFEPLGGTETLVPELARRGIVHAAPDTSRYRDSEGEDVVGWTNTDLTGSRPASSARLV